MARKQLGSQRCHLCICVCSHAFFSYLLSYLSTKSCWKYAKITFHEVYEPQRIICDVLILLVLASTRIIDTSDDPYKDANTRGEPPGQVEIIVLIWAFGESSNQHRIKKSHSERPGSRHVQKLLTISTSNGL